MPAHAPHDLVLHDIQDFLLDRQARNLSPRTLRWYADKLALWRAFLEREGVTATGQVTGATIRRFLAQLQLRHNPGGVRNVYGALRAFLRWYREEYPEALLQDPLRKVKPPKAPDTPLEPLNLDHLAKMLRTCERRTFSGDRDRAVLLLLLDTGVRHQELTDLRVGDVDLARGAVLVRSGKGRKARTVFVGAQTRRALLAYLRHRRGAANDAPLWVSAAGQELSKAGLRQIVRRRAVRAGVPEPSMHSFRRAFAINALRNGMDLLTLQRLLGHSSMAVLSRYLKQVDADLQEAHKRHGPVDRLLR